VRIRDAITRPVVLVAASALAVSAITTIAIVNLHTSEPTRELCRYEEPRPAPPPIEYQPAPREFAKRPPPPPIDRGPATAPVA
jgi:hypothetical protein